MIYKGISHLDLPKSEQDQHQGYKMQQLVQCMPQEIPQPDI